MFLVESRLTRIAILVLALFLAGFLVFFGVRMVLASYYSGRGNLAGYRRATALEPSNAYYWFLLGRYWQYNFENPDLDEAILAYRKALSIDQRSADVWLDLAAAYETTGNSSEAGEAFVKAKSVYPLSPDVAWRYGNFLLRQGQVAPAFSEIHRALKIDPLRSADGFSVCFRIQPNAVELLNNIIPATTGGYLSILHALMERRDVDTSLIVWARLVALQQRIVPQDAAELVGSLQQAGRINEATRVWGEAMALAGSQQAAEPPSSVLWDGSFESSVVGFGYAWRYSTSGSRGVQIYRDKKQAHSGQFSMRVTFDGQTDLSFRDICHRAPVQEMWRYDFSAWVRSESLTTNQGLRFGLWAVGVPNKNPVATDEIRGTQAWMQLKASWVAPTGAREAEVCAVRDPSDQQDNKISGSVWIDDVSLVPSASRLASRLLIHQAFPIMETSPPRVTETRLQIERPLGARPNQLRTSFTPSEGTKH